MRPLLSAAVLLISFPAFAQTVQHGLRVPTGFEVVEYADSKLANDIFTMTTDPLGRIVVSGPGYIRVLIEDEKTGLASRAIDIGSGSKEGAQGLFWEGEFLYYMADGGLRRYRVAPDGKVAGPSELVRAMKTGGEHHAHAIKRGPDGWLYVLAGNTTGIDKTCATLPSSPIKEPVAGCVLRFSPDLRQSEIVADGFRNAYDFDFNLDGELFTFDSDNERCVSLPWYEFTRFYHVVPGGHYGWRALQHGQFWRLPPYSVDVVAPLLDLGRGSPTGVACYRHAQFPEEYRGGLFLADWTFGRIYFLTLKREGTTYTTEKQVFLQATGDNGFAPTALVVHPKTGDLFVSIGGRGTRGAVYRIRFPSGLKVDPTALAKVRTTPRSLDMRAEGAGNFLKRATTGDAVDRLLALQTMYRHNERFAIQEIIQAVRNNLAHADRHVRWAAVNLGTTLDGRDRGNLVNQVRTGPKPWDRLGGQLVANPADLIRSAGPLANNFIANYVAVKDADAEQSLAAIRIIQLALGDLTDPKKKGTVWEGYSPRLAIDPKQGDEARAVLRVVFPTKKADVDREISRTLAMLEDDDAALLTRVAECFSAESPPIEDIHYLAVLARLKAPRPEEATSKTASALLDLDKKYVKDKLNRESHWPLRIAEIHAELAKKDPKLNDALLAHADFGRADHALFARCPGFDRKRAAKLFLARAAKDADYPWNADLVGLLGELPADEALPVLRRLWGHAGLEESILPVLSKYPAAADRDKFLHGLTSPQPATMRLSLESLEKLPAKDTEPKHVLALVLALRRLGDGKDEKQLQERLGKYLQTVTGQDKFGADKQAWANWFAKAHPTLAARLAGPDGVDVAAWEKRLAMVDWSKGDATRGDKVYIKANCASCHSGTQALGPDLRGVANRFSRADLLTAIIQPSKDIAVRYRTTHVETVDGKSYQGLVIYEAVDSLIVQTGPATTIRLTGAQIAAKRFTDLSLMPAGLLDMLKDEEIADLLTYLKELGGAAVKK